MSRESSPVPGTVRASPRKPVSPPSQFLTWTELPRTYLELLSLIGSWRYLEQLPPGDGHTVLVLPGFASGDAWTLFLRRLLRHLGYDVHRWDLGENTGRRALRHGLYRRVNEIVGRSSEPFSVIGHSLGGMNARELAQSFPSHIRQVISLGSPFRGRDGEGVNETVHRLFQRTSGQHLPPGHERGPNERRPRPRVPSTSIYSRTDGVAAWQLCVEDESPISESIETYGSHAGMTLNPLVLYIVADRLSQPAGEWKKFDTRRIPRAAMEMTMMPAADLFRMGFRNPWRNGL